MGKVAIVSTVKGSVEELTLFVNYHLNYGVDEDGFIQVNTVYTAKREGRVVCFGHACGGEIESKSDCVR